MLPSNLKKGHDFELTHEYKRLLHCWLWAYCEMNPHPMDMDLAVQNAVSTADHEALAEHYENSAQEMRDKADEYKKLPAQYGNYSGQKD